MSITIRLDAGDQILEWTMDHIVESGGVQCDKVWGYCVVSAYTRSTKTAAAVGSAVESGMISINHLGLSLPETPFGGIKDSGMGSEGGTEGIEAYLSTKFLSQI